MQSKLAIKLAVCGDSYDSLKFGGLSRESRFAVWIKRDDACPLGLDNVNLVFCSYALKLLSL